MRTLHLVLLVAATAAVTWVLCSSRYDSAPGPASGGALDAAPPDDRSQEEVERLLLEKRRLEAEVERLTAELTSREDPVAPKPRTPLPPPEPLPSDPEELLAAFLDEYERTNRASPRHLAALRAAAPRIVDELIGIALDPDAPVGLRAQAAGLLCVPSLREESRAIHALMDLARPGGHETLIHAALRSLRQGGPEVLSLLERSAWEYEKPVLRSEALRCIAQIAGTDANRVLQSLFDTAPDDSGRASVLAYLNPLDPSTALAVIDLAYRASPGASPRLAAAAVEALGRLRSPEAKAYATARLAETEDPAVRRALEQARARQNEVPRWHALRATGAPNVDDVTQDHQDAWASHLADGGIEWLELTYDPPLRAHTARVFEVHRAGEVIRVEAEFESGDRTTLWSGTDPTREPGVFEVEFPLTPYRVKKLRIVLDTRLKQGWNEIDAVELVGPDGRAWARDARASSNYGEG
jgi:hypothetical protein